MEVKPTDESSSWQRVSVTVDAAINQLPDELRIPVVRYYLERADQRKIAGELGVTHSAISKRLQRGIHELRARLAKRGIALSAVVLSGLLLKNAAEAAPASLAAALGKMAIAGTVKAAGGTAASAGAKTVAGGIIVKTSVAIGIAAVLVTGGVAAHKLRGEAEPPVAPVPEPMPTASQSVETPPALPVQENAVPTAVGDAHRKTARPAPKTPEELAKLTVAALSKGNVAAARQLYPTREEFTKNFANADAAGMYDSYSPMLDESLKACAEQLRGAEYVRWNPRFSREPVTVAPGQSVGVISLAVGAQAMDNTHVVIRLNGKEHDLKLDEMMRLDGAWRMFSIPEFSSGGESQTLDQERTETGMLSKETENLAGLWQAVELEANGKRESAEVAKGFRVLIEGDKITFNPDAENRPSRFILDPTNTPKSIDFIPQDGPANGQRLPVGIYSVEGDRLRLCIDKEVKTGRRPTVFETRPGDGLALMVLKRVNPTTPHR